MTYYGVTNIVFDLVNLPFDDFFINNFCNYTRGQNYKLLTGILRPTLENVLDFSVSVLETHETRYQTV